MTTKQLLFPLGSENIGLQVSHWGDSKTLYLNLHENEQTSVQAARAVLPLTGGILLELKSRGQRLITFRSRGVEYTFDPNRIFGKEGIRKTLSEYGPCDARAMEEVETFARAVLNTIGSYAPQRIIALHNTTADYSMDSFAPGGECEQDVQDVYINPQKHRADFFYTIRREVFEAVKAGGYNVALQNEHVADDGSLSVYCARQGWWYVNTEALHGHLDEQKEMLHFLAGLK